jgi:isopentenyl diphosphate isomerase/L-lactate dehydrogenase-like FMN-dependent dehydrogenase
MDIQRIDIGIGRSSLALGAFLYAYGSAGTNSTYHANQRAFQKFGIIPRMLVNATRRSLEVRRLQFRVVSGSHQNC